MACTKNYFILPKICFEAIQNDSKSNRPVQASTEVCHQIFGGWQMKTMWNLPKNFVMVMEKDVLLKKMFTNGLNMGFAIPSLKKTVKEKFLDSVVNKESHADSLLRHLSTTVHSISYYQFLSYWINCIYIYIYIYIYIRFGWKVHRLTKILSCVNNKVSGLFNLGLSISLEEEKLWIQICFKIWTRTERLSEYIFSWNVTKWNLFFNIAPLQSPHFFSALIQQVKKVSLWTFQPTFACESKKKRKWKQKIKHACFAIRTTSSEILIKLFNLIFNIVFLFLYIHHHHHHVAPASADILDPLSPFLPIIHRLRQVLKVTSCVLT